MHFSEEAQLYEHCSQRLKSWGIFAPPLLLVPATTGSGASKIFDSLPTGPAFTAIGLIWALLFGLTVTLLNRKAGNTDETLSLFSTIPVLTKGGNEIIR